MKYGLKKAHAWWIAFTTEGEGAKGVAIADLDGDGRNDLAVTLQGAARLVLLLTR